MRRSGRVALVLLLLLPIHLILADHDDRPKVSQFTPAQLQRLTSAAPHNMTATEVLDQVSPKVIRKWCADTASARRRGDTVSKLRAMFRKAYADEMRGDPTAPPADDVFYAWLNRC